MTDHVIHAPAQEAPWWHGPVTSLDFETTGTNTADDRFVTAAVTTSVAHGIPMLSTSWIVDPGIDIPDKATQIHGITTVQAQATGADPAHVLSLILRHLAAAVEGGTPIVIFNAKFDVPLLFAECLRHGLDRPVLPRIIDPLVIDKQCDRYRRGPRNLTALCEHYGVEFAEADAHTAAGDTVASVLLARAVLDRHASTAPDFATPQALHDAQATWSTSQSRSLRAHWQGNGDERWKTVTDGWPVPQETC